MNVKRFTARTSRDALSLVRQALGEDAVVLSTKPSVDGVVAERLANQAQGITRGTRGKTFDVHAVAPKSTVHFGALAQSPPSPPEPLRSPLRGAPLSRFMRWLHQ